MQVVRYLLFPLQKTADIQFLRQGSIRLKNVIYLSFLGVGIYNSSGRYLMLDLVYSVVDKCVRGSCLSALHWPYGLYRLIQRNSTFISLGSSNLFYVGIISYYVLVISRAGVTLGSTSIIYHYVLAISRAGVTLYSASFIYYYILAISRVSITPCSASVIYCYVLAISRASITLSSTGVIYYYVLAISRVSVTLCSTSIICYYVLAISRAGVICCYVLAINRVSFVYSVLTRPYSYLGLYSSLRLECLIYSLFSLYQY